MLWRSVGKAANRVLQQTRIWRRTIKGISVGSQILAVVVFFQILYGGLSIDPTFARFQSEGYCFALRPEIPGKSLIGCSFCVLVFQKMQTIDFH
jgi:hypothetical protein